MRHNPRDVALVLTGYLTGYCVAMAECRVDVARLAADFQNQLATLRRQMAEYGAEVERLRQLDERRR